MHHRPWSRARSLLAAVMVRFRVCPNLAGGPARTSRGDLTSVRLSGRPHPQPGPPVSSSLSWVDSCSPTKRTLDRTQPGDTGLLVYHGCRSFFGFVSVSTFSPPEVAPSRLQLSVGGEEASPSASSLGLTITGHLTGGGPLTRA